MNRILKSQKKTLFKENNNNKQIIEDLKVNNEQLLKERDKYKIKKEKLINEIEMLPDNYDIIIDKKNKFITYNKIDYQEYTLYLDSKEGMDVLDKWYDKWINILRFIRSKTNDIVFELSGGLDTRIIAALWLSANINLNKIEIRSYLRTPEDLRIASLIANNFKFISYITVIIPYLLHFCYIINSLSAFIHI